MVRDIGDPADAVELRNLLEAAGRAKSIAFDLQLSSRMARDPFQVGAGAAAHTTSKVRVCGLSHICQSIMSARSFALVMHLQFKASMQALI